MNRLYPGGEVTGTGIDRIETHEFKPGQPNFIIQAGDGGEGGHFVIGSHIEMRLISPAGGNPQNKRLVLPAVALEVKRYLERDMLDECSGTPARIKAATPYCLFVVIAEYLKMDDCRPELSKIDEIYVLRKQRNSDRLAADLKPNPIDADLVWDLYQMVWQHLRKLWWDPEAGVRIGKMFNFT